MHRVTTENVGLPHAMKLDAAMRPMPALPVTSTCAPKPVRKVEGHGTLRDCRMVSVFLARHWKLVGRLRSHRHPLHHNPPGMRPTSTW